MATKQGEQGEAATVASLECCPDLGDCDRCERLDVQYHLPFTPGGKLAALRQRVEVTLRFRIERCPGPLTLGDIIYTTTLLPGEQVRLFTSDRHTRFTYDHETDLAYRHATASEESFFMTGMASAMSSLDVVENRNTQSTFESSSVGGGGGIDVNLGIIEIGGSVKGGSYDSRSTSEFARELSQHAQSSSRHVEAGVRAASSTSVGEVETRAHTETESQDDFESSSRVFSNANRCHALAFYFYKLMKCQTVRFQLVGIDRRVTDPAAPTLIRPKQPIPTGGVSVVPNSIVATSKARLDVERMARTSVLEREREGATFGIASRLFTEAGAAEPLAPNARQEGLAEVDKELVAAGLLDKSGEVSKDAKARLDWERTVLLPTPGVIVKGCLDECNVCEPELQRRVKLENDMLERQVALLEKSQEYRCCPAESNDGGEDA